MFKNRAGWQILIIAGLLLGLLLIYTKFQNISISKNQKITEDSDQIITDLNSKGKTEAKLEIKVLSSYDCGWSRKYFNETIQPFINNEIQKYDVSLRYDLVAFQSSSSLLATEAAYCANDQGKFWEANNILWKLGEDENMQESFGRESLIKNLENIGLKKTKFINCLDSHKYMNVILEKGQWYLGRYDQLGFPTTFFNDEEMKMLIEGKMQAVGAVNLKDFINNINKVLNTK